MKPRERVRRFAKPGHPPRRVAARAIADVGTKAFAVDPFHAKHIHFADALDAVEADDVRMAQGGEDPCLATETRRKLGATTVVPDHLEGRQPPEDGVDRAIHLAHSASRSALEHPIVADHLTGLEAHDARATVSSRDRSSSRSALRRSGTW